MSETLKARSVSALYLRSTSHIYSRSRGGIYALVIGACLISCQDRTEGALIDTMSNSGEPTSMLSAGTEVEDDLNVGSGVDITGGNDAREIDERGVDERMPGDLSTLDAEVSDEAPDLLSEPEDQAIDPALFSFMQVHFSATHNSYEGGARRSIYEQLEAGVRALEYDIHDNDFEREGYRLGHLRHGDAVDYSGRNPSADGLSAWLDVMAEWSRAHPRHAPLLLTIDIKDNLMDNQDFASGNLARLNATLTDHLHRIWRPDDGVDRVEDARGHTLCILSGDRGTRRGYLHDVGSAPALAVNANGSALEVHDSGSGSLWYWGGSITGDQMSWRRHGRYDSGRRPAILINTQGQVIEAHQSESQSKLWASAGSLDSSGELTLASADRFSDGEFPSLAWRDMERGLFTVRYRRGGAIYERDGVADMSRREIRWSDEVSVETDAGLFTRDEATHLGTQLRVSNTQASSGYPNNTLWLQITTEGGSRGEPIRYEQVCFVEWQRDEHQDPLLGQQVFGALPGRDYASLPSAVRTNYVIRGWQYAGRDLQVPIPQIPSTDSPFSASYMDLMQGMNALE